ncbi:OLC1v1005090C1 [Oldenlandia corymbosa var. corymbosa]|uniref:OLC1v1005090C1 n=1 Tax=Oldenlandia corymbosa var. corymbosa TaxID=529605 RepID=A0AAV1DG86_OLDCO|nr:OLC1v1005090C1 [Oldenlandia corymbosa var. corymbosa]
MARRMLCITISLYCLFIAHAQIFDITTYGAKPGGADISQALLTAWKGACDSSTPSTILIPKGKFILKEAYLKGPCKAPHIALTNQGSVIALPEPTSVKKNNEWIMIQYVDHLTINGNGVYDGVGAKSWALNKEHCWNSTQCNQFPNNFGLHNLKHLTVRDITSKDAKSFHFISKHRCLGDKQDLSNTMNGVRIKTWAYSQPNEASNMHFENIRMDNVGNPINIDQLYCPSGGCNMNMPSRVKLNKISFKGITGTSSTPVAVNLVCSSTFPCQGVEIGNIDLKFTGGAAQFVCSNARPAFSGKQNPKINCNKFKVHGIISHDLGGKIHPSILNLEHLEYLDLYYNNFSGTPIPPFLGSLKNLRYLDLDANFVDLPPDSFCNLTSLISMDLSFNQFEGSIPLCIGNLSSLTSLYLESNKLGGELPDELGNLKQLTTLDLSVNYFEGPIPSSFGQLSMMKSLNLNANQLNGTIPPALLNLTELDTLDVTYNSLSGALSESDFGKLKSLRHFRISKNKFLSFNVSSRWIPPFQLDELVMDFVFIGTQFPPFLQTQRNISHIALRNASISGSLPGWCWTTSADLFYFDLSNNFLTGPVPAFGANHSINSRFGALNLANNHLTGNIPEELCNLQSLKVISLANNLLTGKIPLCLGEMRQLEVLDLANNSLSGQIPYTLGELGGLNFLHLSGNKLFGLLPSSLQNLTFLVTLDLANNQFRDSIPDWIGKEFSRLRFLRLQSNNFYGNISVNLCQLPSLQVLNLAENNLVGNIPPCLGNLSAMLSDESRGDTGIDSSCHQRGLSLGSIMNDVKASRG